MNLLFDFGGTRMRFSLTDDNKTLQNTLIYNTIQNYNEALEFIQAKKSEITLNHQIDKISGCIAGVIQNNTLLHAPHISDWNNKPIAPDFLKIFNAQNITIANDAESAALAEASLGAGSKYNIVAYITIGTGVGGARIVNKTIDERTFGFEPGHQIVNFNANEVNTLEQLTSGFWIEQKMGKRASQIDDPLFWRDIELKIAYGLNNVIVMWSPDIIILGGGIVNSGLINLENISTHIAKLIKIFPTIPPIVKTEIGHESGLVGAMLNL